MIFIIKFHIPPWVGYSPPPSTPLPLPPPPHHEPISTFPPIIKVKYNQRVTKEKENIVVKVRKKCLRNQQHLPFLIKQMKPMPRGYRQSATISSPERGCSSNIASSYFFVQVKSQSMLHHRSVGVSAE